MRLLVLTRFDPLNGTSGSGTYLYAILKHLQQHGVEIVVCWSESPRSVARCGWFVVPRDFAGIATLLMYGAIRLGRLNLFPSFLLPFKARLRKTLKRLLCALGFGRLFRENRPVDGENREDATQAPAANPYAWDRPPDPYERAFFRAGHCQIPSRRDPLQLLLDDPHRARHGRSRPRPQNRPHL